MEQFSSELISKNKRTKLGDYYASFFGRFIDVKTSSNAMWGNENRLNYGFDKTKQNKRKNRTQDS